MCYSVTITTPHWRHIPYLVGVPLLGEDVPDEGLLHFLLLDQELPQPLHGQRRGVAAPGTHTLTLFI